MRMLNLLGKLYKWKNITFVITLELYSFYFNYVKTPIPEKRHKKTTHNHIIFIYCLNEKPSKRATLEYIVKPLLNTILNIRRSLCLSLSSLHPRNPLRSYQISK